MMVTLTVVIIEIIMPEIHMLATAAIHMCLDILIILTMDTAVVMTGMNILEIIMMSTATAIADIDTRRISMVGNSIAGTGGTLLQTTAIVTMTKIASQIMVGHHLRQSLP